jgi:hypothetical protein
MPDRSLLPKPKEVPEMITKTKLSPSVAAVRQRALVGASLPGGIACAPGILRIEGIGLSSLVADSYGVRPTNVPTMQAFHVGDRAWSPPD